MKLRNITIILAACLGFIGAVQATGVKSISAAGLSIEEIFAGKGLEEEISTFITDQMHSSKVPGLSIALIQDGNILWVEGFGLTNSLTGKPVVGDTIFEAASISKAITAYAALRLVEKGVLSLDEPGQHYLSKPWLPPSDYAEQITLRHLLTHTSGLTNNVNPVNKSIVFPPGERYQYSGVGFIYLQLVMEQATGKPLEQITKEQVFDPLEMDSSSYVTPINMMPRLAYGHIHYGFIIPLLAPMLAVAFTLILIVWLIIQRIRLGKFRISAMMLWISYAIAASVVLSIMIYILGSGVNKWLTLSALWVILFGAGMALLIFAGRKLIARLPGKWQRPRIRVPVLLLWSFICALALLMLTNALSGPVPRSPAGTPSAAYSFHTTAPDLAKFLLELISPQHMDPALMVEMTSPKVQSGENESWGLGIGIQHTSKGDVLFHSGNNPDFHALMLIDQELRNGVVIMTNGENGAPLVDEIARYALDKISGQG